LSSIRKLLTAELTWKQGLCSEAKMRGHVITIDSSKDEGDDNSARCPR
jgi:hypothetical protein